MNISLRLLATDFAWTACRRLCLDCLPQILLALLVADFAWIASSRFSCLLGADCAWALLPYLRCLNCLPRIFILLGLLAARFALTVCRRLCLRAICRNILPRLLALGSLAADLLGLLAMDFAWIACRFCLDCLPQAFPRLLATSLARIAALPGLLDAVFPRLLDVHFPCLLAAVFILAVCRRFSLLTLLAVIVLSRLLAVAFICVHCLPNIF